MATEKESKIITKKVRVQLEYVTEMLEETEPWLYSIYRIAIDEFNTMLIMNQVTAERLEDVRNTIHICNSSVANMSDHGVDAENIIDDNRLFGYLYSVHDMLADMEVNGTFEEESPDDENS